MRTLVVATVVVIALAAVTGCRESTGGSVLEPVERPRSASAAFPSAATGAPGGVSPETVAPESSPRPSSSTGTATPSAVTPDAKSTTDRAEASTGAPASPPGGPVLLRYRFDKGSELRFASLTETVSEMRSGSGEGQRPTTSKMDAEVRVKVLDVSGDRAQVEIKVERARGKADAPEAQRSTQEAGESLQGVTMASTFTTQGATVESKVTRGSIQEATAAGIASEIGFMGLLLPAQAVDKGATWTSELDFGKVFGQAMPMANATFANAKLPVRFTLESLDRSAGTARITFKLAGKPSMTVKMPEPPEGRQRPEGTPREMKASFELDSTGTAVFDVRAGMIARMDTTGTLGISGLMGMNVTQRLKSSLRRQ